MITATLMKHKKLIAAIVVISLIALYFTSSLSNGWEEGAPEASIVCSIKAASGNSITGSANIGDNTVIGQMVPLTSFTTNIDTLDAMTQYTISFSATMSTKTAKFGEALTNSIFVTGLTGGSKANYNYLDSTGTVSSGASVAGTAGSSSTLSIPGFVEQDYTPSPISIMGDVIDGSVFTFTISSTATDGRVSSTTATLTISVDNGGNIYIAVDDITVTVDGDVTVFYDGWDNPASTEYIVFTYSPEPIYQVQFCNQMSGTINSPMYGTKSVALQGMNEILADGKLTQRQYDCGIAQLNALP